MSDLNNNEMAIQVYRLLSHFYLNSPEADKLNSILKWCTNVLEHENQLPSNITPAVKQIKSSLEPHITDELVLALQEDYVRLVRSPSKDTSPPPPYESVYLEGSLWGNSTVEVSRAYKRNGLEVQGQYKSEPPDHIGLELQFMASLSEKGKKEDVQLDFLTNHLTKWFALYRKKASEHSPHKFYFGVLSLTGEWINLHKEYLKESSYAPL